MYKYTNTNTWTDGCMRWMLIGTVPAPEWALGSILDARTNTS